MRVTHTMLADTVLRNIQRNEERLEQLQSQLTSGARLQRPSDDPIGVARALAFQEGLDQTSQYLANIDQASAWLNTTDSALDAISSLLQRARELTIQAANDTLSSENRAAIQAEVSQLQYEALSVANSRYGSDHVFAGTRTTAAAYTTSSSASYQGNQQPILREIAPGVTLPIGVDGKQTLNPVLDALDAVQVALASNDAATIGGSLAGLDTAQASVLSARVQVGAKMNRLELVKSHLGAVQVSLSSLLSSEKDVDMAQAITNFSTAQVVYAASLKAGAQALQPSLLDYLH